MKQLTGLILTKVENPLNAINYVVKHDPFEARYFLHDWLHGEWDQLPEYVKWCETSVDAN
jgi:hypothetical protein